MTIRPFVCAARYEPPLAVVRADGTLTAVAAPQLRGVLLKCLSDQPTAVLVDATGLSIVDDLSLTAFIAAARHAAAWPAVPMLICAPSPEVRAALRRLGADRHVTMCVDLVDGRAVAAQGELPPQVRDRFPPTPDSVRAARALVTAACERWRLPALVAPASLAVSELVTNAVRHAGTSMDVVVTRARRYVHLAVRDYSRQPARLRGPDSEAEPGGRGLLLVEAVSAGWGCTLLPDGKVTWVSLSRAPSSAASTWLS
jgi:anti-anti-sigma regulatory factor